MKGVNYFLVVATNALSSTGIAEKAHMAAHLALKTLKAKLSELITSPCIEMGYLLRCRQSIYFRIKNLVQVIILIDRSFSKQRI